MRHRGSIIANGLALSTKEQRRLSPIGIDHMARVDNHRREAKYGK
jgi:hypothetical protein